MLITPTFTLPKPNERPTNTTDAAWWLRCHLLALEPSTRDGGTYANKKGFHNKGSQIIDRGQGNSSTDYSIRDAVNRNGLWWRDFSSGFDWTFTTAQSGNYALIAQYTKRLLDSSLNPADPRLDLVLFEFYGQADWDSYVEGRNELRETDVTSDSSHLWHIHFSFLRSRVGDFWSMWALYTVLIGWSVQQWRDTLGETQVPTVPPVKPPVPTGLPNFAPGSRVLRNASPDMRGTDVLFIQKFIGPYRTGKADGVYGAKTEAGVKWYQRRRGIRDDGIVGPTTWRHMGIR
jgi:peptidoglycan hydrolase-like protein with peptidoglycan-binding domain